MCISKPDIPAPLAPKDPPKIVKALDPRVKEARDAEETRARGRRGRQSTIATSPFGVTTQANVAVKTALGQ